MLDNDQLVEIHVYVVQSLRHVQFVFQLTYINWDHKEKNVFFTIWWPDMRAGTCEGGSMQEDHCNSERRNYSINKGSR